MIEVSIEQLYAEACRRIGELTITNGVLQAEVVRLRQRDENQDGETSS